MSGFLEGGTVQENDEGGSIGQAKS